ncbi:3-deoxy-manno-octulosonate cytidylyltransferase [hydrothermal vent metagenome]|uniref:3-deoxy-manno-octulosonate cytidylyltransferase n=1 Tax=hydrothermal vent metagenome TaxID=652676 RepID=A0A3B0XGK3_9ZZZZ
MMTEFHIVIPARYASSRFPGKPLVEIDGKTMLQHVYNVAAKSSASNIVIATDDVRIAQVAESFCSDVLMTSEQHHSGTDRLAEVCQIKRWGDDEIVVNLQGDEPLTPIALLHQVANNLHSNQAASIATLSTPLLSAAEIDDPNIVKLVSDAQGYAMYFSRASIPFERETGDMKHISQYHRHLGIYAYRVAFLNAYSQMPQCELESIERLEQLRAMYYGHKIHIEQAVELPGPGIDTPEDLEKITSLKS